MRTDVKTTPFAPHREQELESLFVDAVDDRLSVGDQARFDAELADSEALRVRFAKYKGAIAELKEAPRESAPPALASVILRRSRRRRFGLKMTAMHQEQYRVPVEVLIPILVGVLVAAFLFFTAH